MLSLSSPCLDRYPFTRSAVYNFTYECLAAITCVHLRREVIPTLNEVIFSGQLVSNEEVGGNRKEKHIWNSNWSQLKENESEKKVFDLSKSIHKKMTGSAGKKWTGEAKTTFETNYHFLSELPKPTRCSVHCDDQLQQQEQVSLKGVPPWSSRSILQPWVRIAVALILSLYIV